MGQLPHFVPPCTRVPDARYSGPGSPAPPVPVVQFVAVEHIGGCGSGMAEFAAQDLRESVERRVEHPSGEL